MPEWTPTLGAVLTRAGTTFRVWAPERRSVDLVVERQSSADAARASHDLRALRRDGDGYWFDTFGDVAAGTLYRYRLDGDDTLVFPDPASRCQPHGVHGPSQVIDPHAFEWTASAWTPPSREQLVLYELHVGTFNAAGTPEGAASGGTFRGVADRLDYLRDLGVTAIELMPLAAAPGRWNWGYDGVALFAPSRNYGSPDDLRRLIDEAHARQLAVFVDVVYNHFGPDGAYATVFSPYYLTDRHPSPWGLAINLDGPQSTHVRRFLIENALHWLCEYRVDGLRLDATHALVDDSPFHFLAELSSTVRRELERDVLLVAEDHRNLAHEVAPVTRGGWGLDALWADDFHHQIRVHVARDREGYYADFTGAAEDIATTMTRGWFFAGQWSPHLNGPRGTDPSSLLPQQFVFCIQNHDQVGNRANGARLNHEVDLAVYRAASTLLLLAAQTPLLFMGQEWASASPFLFFTDHHDELGRLVTAGRRREFGAFAAFGSPDAAASIPDPQDPGTFLRSRLRWDELDRPIHAKTLNLYKRVLRIRRSIAQSRTACAVRALDSGTLALTYPGLLAIVRLSDSGTVDLALGSAPLDIVLSTEEADLAMYPQPITVATADHLSVTFARPGGVVLKRRM